MLYSVNYGYIPNVFSADGEELDVYLLGVDIPVKTYRATIIAIIHRLNDIEDKLVASPEGMTFTADEIQKMVSFQEQYFISEIEIYKEGITKM
jgi:inorganic pyrophosphatase